jgi:microsomal epoxide hydrolase
MPMLQLLKNKFTPETLPYHIIVPSVPGYAFSSGPPLDKNFTIPDAARILDRLMVTIGFGDGYVVQGGDIGSNIARFMAATSPSCKGMSVTLVA